MTHFSSVYTNKGYEILPEVQPTGTVSAKTANYTITAADFGKVMTNTGASGAITFTLPAASSALKGQVIKFAALAAQIINVSPNSADGIYLNGSGVADKDVVVAGTIGNSVTIRCNGSNYEAYYANGVVTKEA